MSRKDHLAWCKTRALEYVDAGELKNAVSSMLSDMTKHPETNSPALGVLMLSAMKDVANGDTAAVRRWVEGFN
jgi:hypothetical protein